MSIPIISRTNTIDEWRIQTNQEATTLNNLETGDYTKSNGILTVSGNSQIIITANGTSLQVSNSALFQSNVTVGGDVAIGVQETATGNVTVGGVLTVRGTGNALQVSNNALVNGNMQVTRTITTNNITANSNVTIGGNESVAGVLRLTGSNDVLYVNTGIAKVNTAVITDLTSTNADIQLATIAEEQVTLSTIQIGTIIRANAYNLTSTTANVGIANITTGVLVTANIATLNANVSYTNTGIVTGNTLTNNLVVTQHTNTATLRTSGVANVASGLSVTGNTNTSNIVNSQHINTATLRTSGVANVESGLSVSGRVDVTGNTVSGNLVTSGLTHTGTLRTTGRADFGGILTAGATTLSSAVVSNDLQVQGNFVIAGQTSFDSNIIVLRSTTPQPNGSGYSYFGVNRGNTSSVSGTANANAYIRWNEPSYVWEVRDVLNTNDTTAYSKLLTANLISDSLTSTSSSTLASSNTISILTNQQASTGRYANSAFDMANTAYQSGGVTAGGYANSAYRHANSSYIQANSAFDMANTAMVAGGTIAGGYANSAFRHANSSYTQANTATTNAATADQRAVTSGSYANSAYSLANTKFASAGGTISGDVNISGNLTITGTTTYANTTTVALGDNIIVLNADLPQANVPSENAGIEIERGVKPNAQFIWVESAEKWSANNGNSSFYIGSESDGSYANSAFSTANAALSHAGSAYAQSNAHNSYANTTYATGANLTITGSFANSAYAKANTGTILAQAAFDSANNVGPQIQPAFNAANSAGSYANSAFSKANTAQTHANAAYDTANGKISAVTINNGTGISGGTTGSNFTLSIGQAVATSSDVQFASIGVGTTAPGSGNINAIGNITAYYSDERLKTKLGNIDNALDKLLSLSGFYYEANQTAQELGYKVKREVGVSAQEVQSVMPEIVSPAPVDNQYLTVDYSRLVPLIIEAIKELKTQVDELKIPK